MCIPCVVSKLRTQSILFLNTPSKNQSFNGWLILLFWALTCTQSSVTYMLVGFFLLKISEIMSAFPKSPVHKPAENKEGFFSLTLGRKKRQKEGIDG